MKLVSVAHLWFLCMLPKPFCGRKYPSGFKRLNSILVSRLWASRFLSNIFEIGYLLLSFVKGGEITLF